MVFVYLLPFGTVEDDLMSVMATVVSDRLQLPTAILPAAGIPAGSFDSNRQSYNSIFFMHQAIDLVPDDALRLIALTTADLFIPMLTFVFGQAQLDGKVALVSVARLRQENYGLPADKNLLRLRLRKECLHELGHTFGLTHCPDPGCAMSLSVQIRNIDIKMDRYCHACEVRVSDGILRSRQLVDPTKENRS
jgi:archaemetzincin